MVCQCCEDACNAMAACGLLPPSVTNTGGGSKKYNDYDDSTSFQEKAPLIATMKGAQSIESEQCAYLAVETGKICQSLSI